MTRLFPCALPGRARARRSCAAAARGSMARGCFWCACRCMKADGGRATGIWKGGIGPAPAAFSEGRHEREANYLPREQLVRAAGRKSTASLLRAAVNGPVSTAKRPSRPATGDTAWPPDPLGHSSAPQAGAGVGAGRRGVQDGEGCWSTASALRSVRRAITERTSTRSAMAKSCKGRRCIKKR